MAGLLARARAKLPGGNQPKQTEEQTSQEFGSPSRASPLDVHVMNPMGSPRNQHLEHQTPAAHQAPPVSHFLHSGGKAAGAASLFRTLMYLMASWGVSTTILLNVVASHYLFQSIDDVRDAYVAHGAAARIKADALGAFASIFGARDAVHYGIRTKLYYEPLDYATVERILAPIFAANPSIYTVDIAFSDRQQSIVLRRLGDTSDVLIQSDAADCYTIGVRGCSVANETAHESAWYQMGLVFSKKEYRNRASDPSARALSKWIGPEFISRIGASVEGASNTIEWAPSYSLIFYSVFPGTMDKLYAVGKVTLDLTKVGRELLTDQSFGTDGKVYICNRMGRIVAATRPADQVMISQTSGTVHFREIWRLKASWARMLSQDVFRRNAESRFEMTDGTLVLVSPFTTVGQEKMPDDFFVVIVAGRMPFTDPVLAVFCILSFVVACLPYIIIVTIVAVFLLRRRALQIRYRRRMLAVEEAKRALTEVGNALQEAQEMEAVRT